MIQNFRMAIALVSAVGLGTLTGCHQNGTAKAELGAQAPDAGPRVIAREQVPTVEVEQVQRSEVSQVTGSLEADENSDVASKRSGIVQEVNVERGSVVKKGDVLLVLDATDARNALAEGLAQSAELAVRLGINKDSTTFSVEQQPDVKAAKARLDLAEANFRRDSELYEKKVIPKGDYDNSRNSFETSRQAYQSSVQQAAQLYQTYQTSLARLNTLKQTVEDMIVRAPFDGIVAERHVSVGESLQSMQGGAKVVTLVKTNPLRLMLTLPEQLAGLVKQGQSVRFHVTAIPGKQFEGKVRYIGPSLQSTDRTLVVEALVDNAGGELRPGYFAQAELVSPTQATALLVPEKSIKRDGESARVFVLEEGRAREKVVTLGDKKENKVEITSGLKPDEVVIADSARVQDGLLVR